jgi:hypothetical protein
MLDLLVSLLSCILFKTFVTIDSFASDLKQNQIPGGNIIE